MAIRSGVAILRELQLVKSSLVSDALKKKMTAQLMTELEGIYGPETAAAEAALALGTSASSPPSTTSKSGSKG